MLEFDSTAPSDPEGLAAPARQGRRRAISAAPKSARKSREILSSPRWARLPDGQAGEAETAFCAGASLALFDRILRSGEGASEPVFAGALRQRLALKASAAGARVLRLREDEGALRDAQHLAAAEDPGPAGRLHRLWRGLAGQDACLDAASFGEALRLLDLGDAGDVPALIGELRELMKAPDDPVTLAAQAAARAHHLCPRPEGEVFALWTADLMLAIRLGWDRPAPLLATKMLEPSLRRGPRGARPRPNDHGWPQAVTRAYALAAGDAHALAIELSRRAEKLLTVAPKLRAKGSGRVVALLLADDCVSPTRAAKVARLSDRASRRLFDRLIGQGVVRELSGRPNFRLYGL